MSRVTFTVTGHTEDEVYENAVETLRKFTGEERPFRFSFHATPSVTVQMTGEIVLWEADVEAERP